MTVAAQAPGVSRSGVYTHRQLDDTFAKAWEEAEQVAADRLEAEAWRRGVEGVSEPLVSAGKLVCGADGQPLVIQQYSDQLLLALLPISGSASSTPAQTAARSRLRRS